MKRKARQLSSMLAALVWLASYVWAQEEFPELVRRVKPSVVAVVTFNAKGKQLSQGSGFFLADGRIITNRHVLEGAYRAEIHLTEGDKVFPVKGVLGVDGAGDLALLQADVPANVAAPLTIAQEPPQEGETVLVIGNPLGLEGSVSNGIVSAVRDVAGFGRIIQITAPISPGSSGSPVINRAGAVIGVATLQLTEGQSLNFAVPSERVLRLTAGTLVPLGEMTENTAKNQRATAEALYSQGLGFLLRDDCEHALPYFNRAATADPNYAEAWAQSGYCAVTLGRYDEAVMASRKAVALQPNALPAYLNLGAALLRLGQAKEAVDVYKQAAKVDLTNPEPWFALGIAYGRLGKFEDEMQTYRQTLRLKPDHIAAQERLGLVYLKLNRPQDAISAFKQVVMLKPGEAAAFDNLGTAYFKAARYDESAEAYRQALRLNPNFAKAYFNLGVCYVTAGNPQAALEPYNILLTLDPERAARLNSIINP